MTADRHILGTPGTCFFKPEMGHNMGFLKTTTYKAIFRKKDFGAFTPSRPETQLTIMCHAVDLNLHTNNTCDTL